jgi:hypothetical protein
VVCGFSHSRVLQESGVGEMCLYKTNWIRFKASIFYDAMHITILMKKEKNLFSRFIGNPGIKWLLFSKICSHPPFI